MAGSYEPDGLELPEIPLQMWPKTSHVIGQSEIVTDENGHRYYKLHHGDNAPECLRNTTTIMFLDYGVSKEVAIDNEIAELVKKRKLLQSQIDDIQIKIVDLMEEKSNLYDDSVRTNQKGDSDDA